MWEKLMIFVCSVSAAQWAHEAFLSHKILSLLIPIRAADQDVIYLQFKIIWGLCRMINWVPDVVLL